jgi:hypothetical protein
MAPSPIGERFMGVTLAQMKATLVWLMFASSFYVAVEPAPSDLLFLVVLASFMGSGLAISVAVVPLVLFLLLYNLGGLFSFLQVIGDQKAMMFVITSAYMAIAAMFFAYYVAYDPLRRVELIKSGMVFSAVTASIIGLMGYFNLAGLGGLLAPMDRAQGLFKDPNVFSTFLIFPALMLAQGLMLGQQKRPIVSAVWLLIIMGAIFLSFSRGAWISFIMASTFLVLLTFLLTPSARMRGRIIILTIFGVLIVAVLLAALLSIPAVHELFLDRFTLVKYYDAGEKGRFGNQINSIPLLLERPLGFGPAYFRVVFGQDPHNVYINAFSSFGWLGGISYLLLIVSTILIGFKSILMRTPWQHYSIVVFCPLISTIFQGVQIDTEHWRHFYWLLGLMWGLFAASMQPHAAKHEQKMKLELAQ